ncbi:EF-hand domain-containing protein [Falsirhodobacter deserti]|uniref:EF-hand domain-containing protein n=1 Tax=Falsirhodobacter deserti TaxID=1365611 RepID=UPI001F4DF3B6|nr:calcium sensor EFh [Falsirhodobacter deserti]
MTKFLTGATLVAISLAGLSTAFAQSATEAERRTPPMMQPFDELDADGDGSITREEMQARRVQQVEALDENGDGKISAGELARADIARATERAERRAQAMIERLDADGDGLLSAAELATPPAGPDLRRLDTDGDGAISRTEADAARKFMRERHQATPDHRQAH